MSDKNTLSEKSMRVDETIKHWRDGYHAIKPAPLASTSLKMSGVWEPEQPSAVHAQIIKIARLSQEYQSTHVDFTEEDFENWLTGKLKEKAAEQTQTMSDEITLAELRPGAVFVTRDNVYAVKSEYHHELQCECILLESGEYAWFKDRDKTLVREVSVEGFRADD